jgi:hypothetical protein
MRAFTSSIAFKCTLGGYRVTYCDAARNPVVSIWGEYPASVRSVADRLMSATPEPIDAILEATMWHGKRATA